MQQNNPAGAKASEVEKSRLGISFGPQFEEGQIKMSLELSINNQKSQNQIDYLKQLVGENIDLDWSLVGEIDAIDKDKLIEAIQNMFTKDLNQHFGEVKVRTYSDGEKVYFSIKLDLERETELMSFVQVLIEGGLNQLVTEQDNQLDLNLQINNNFDLIEQKLKQGERLVSALFQNLKFELNLNLHNQVSEKVSQIVKSIDPDFLESPPMLFIKYFKNIDADYSFESTQDLPEVIRNQVLFGKKLEKIPEDKKKFNSTKYPNVIAFLENVGQQGQLYVTLQGIGAIKFDIKAPTLGKFLKNYGNAILGIISVIPDAIEGDQVGLE